MEFFEAVRQYPFLQNALLMGVLSSLACGPMGAYVVVKRISFISGGIAHAVLGGMGVAYFFGRSPMAGALIAALLAAVLIGVVSLRARQREDTAIGALWATGMAIGIVFISRTPGYNVDLMSYLFGNILLVSRSDLLWTGLLDAVILGAVFLYYNPLLAVCFDEENARLQGVPVERAYLGLLCLIAATVVILVHVAGIVLVIALLTLPAAIAGIFVRRLARIMLAATVLGVLFAWGGLFLSYGPDLPAGATIILLAAASYLACLLFAAAWSRSRPGR
ncbi:MAG: metal ABC transporter permease [bacterium]